MRISRDVTQLSTNHWINFKTKMLLTSFQSLLSEETPQAHWFIGLWWLWFCGAGWPGKKNKKTRLHATRHFLVLAWSGSGSEGLPGTCQEHHRESERVYCVHASDTRDEIALQNHQADKTIDRVPHCSMKPH